MEGPALVSLCLTSEGTEGQDATDTSSYTEVLHKPLVLRIPDLHARPGESLEEAEAEEAGEPDEGRECDEGRQPAQPAGSPSPPEPHAPREPSESRAPHAPRGPRKARPPREPREAAQARLLPCAAATIYPSLIAGCPPGLRLPSLSGRWSLPRTLPELDLREEVGPPELAGL